LPEAEELVREQGSETYQRGKHRQWDDRKQVAEKSKPFRRPVVANGDFFLLGQRFRGSLQLVSVAQDFNEYFAKGFPTQNHFERIATQNFD
jgi:hypothetical protein